jgi:hypothetical protein
MLISTIPLIRAVLWVQFWNGVVVKCIARRQTEPELQDRPATLTRC